MKVCADVVEALAGAFFVHSGDRKAPGQFLRSCGVLPNSACNHQDESHPDKTQLPSAGMARFHTYTLPSMQILGIYTHCLSKPFEVEDSRSSVGDALLL